MITIQNESFIERLDELKPLLPLHYEELALNKDKVPLDPEYEIYFRKELAGELLFTVVRSEGKFVGYFIGFIAPHLHYRTCLTCTMDIFYVHPDYRNNGTGKELFSFVKAELKKRGVQRWFVGSKLHKDSSYLFLKFGFEKVEEYYSVWLGE